MKNFIDEKIAYNESQIKGLIRDNKRLSQQKQDAEGKQGMEKWVGFRFESSSGLTPEFSTFAREYKRAVKKMIGDKFELLNWNRGHFYISGFVKNKTNGKYVYFRISDVRHFPDDWYNNILVRTAQNDKDYTGRKNHYANFGNLSDWFEELSQ